MEDLLPEKALENLKKTVRLFVTNQVAPLERLEKEYVQEFSKEKIASLQEKAWSAGFKALGAKKEWGGKGLSLYERSVIYEEASQHRLGIYHPAGDSFGEELPNILEKCKQNQIEKYVKPAIKQGKGCFIALWEEEDDNHIENINCLAIKNNKGWLINGSKSYIQKLDQSNFGIILVNCLDINGEKQPTLFIIEVNEATVVKETVLLNVQKSYDLVFKDVLVDDSRRIGAIGEGKELMKQWLTESQILLSARCLGVSARALQYAKDYAKIRITRGKPLAEFPTIRTMIASGIVKLEAARLMVYHAAKKIDQGDMDAESKAKMAKLISIDTASKIIDDTLQIYGGAGFAGDFPMERWYKEIRFASLDLQKKETIIEDIAKIHL
ncbi:acyl-CoA dehydrogenase family protein [Bacillus sp. JJ1533]|uniref:acyl-CoA dehydrogenase family protein n=1 Tax=Bacillus sp. JJ1533 TaxID=3122959 RepID=UPI002FFF153F